MRTVALAIALLMGGAAMAQTGQSSTTDMNGQPQAATDSSNMQTTTPTTPTTDRTQTGWNANAGQTNMAMNTAATPTTVQPSNADPRRDARGIKVISMAAMVPAGYNGVPSTGTGEGGPLLDPNTGQPMSDTGNYPPCTRRVTDKCVQTYERHRAR